MIWGDQILAYQILPGKKTNVLQLREKRQIQDCSRQWCTPFVAWLGFPGMFQRFPSLLRCFPSLDNILRMEGEAMEFPNCLHLSEKFSWNTVSLSVAYPPGPKLSTRIGYKDRDQMWVQKRLHRVNVWSLAMPFCRWGNWYPSKNEL